MPLGALHGKVYKQLWHPVYKYLGDTPLQHSPALSNLHANAGLLI